jgi:N-acyl-D-amino-acid deacylase
VKKEKYSIKKHLALLIPQTQQPLTTASPFNLASVSKQFYTMMTMILKEQGKLNYDDAVQKHLPIFPYKQHYHSAVDEPRLRVWQNTSTSHKAI